jgi:hypothetical protein
MSRVARRLMPCLPWKSRDDDAAGDAEDARAREDDDDDDDGAVAALDALARREARRTRARDEMRRGVGTRAKGAGAARGANRGRDDARRRRVGQRAGGDRAARAAERAVRARD